MDVIEDDEKRMSPAHPSPAERVLAVRPAIHGHDTVGHDTVAEAGGNAAVICIDAAGFGALSLLRRPSKLRIDGIGARYREPDGSFERPCAAVTTPPFSPSDRAMPVVCSGQRGGQAPETCVRRGRRVDPLHLCGGTVSHPGGPGAGARAVREAREAAVAGGPLDVDARQHRDLARSLAAFSAGKGA